MGAFPSSLIQNTLSSMPIYFMSLMCIPRLAKLRLEQIQRDFLWVEGALTLKPHLVKWAIVCLDKKKGAMGVRCLSLLNMALFCKWCWCFAKKGWFFGGKLLVGSMG